MQPILIKPMASNQANTGISLNEKSSFSTSGDQVPAALSMMVDSMTSMVERAKIDIENADQRARADLENIDQRARKDVALLDQRAREDIQKVDKKARRDLAILDKRARDDHELLRKIRKSKGVTS
jgi:DNA gyrase/topoisomerase IV subunit A